MIRVLAVDFTRPIRIFGGFYLPTSINLEADHAGKYEMSYADGTLFVSVLKEPASLVGKTFRVDGSRLDSWVGYDAPEPEPPSATAPDPEPIPEPEPPKTKAKAKK